MTHHQPKNPRVVLLEDHRRIDLLLDRLIATVRAGDREAAAKLWATTEKALLAHLDVEEMFILPALARTDPAEVDEIRREHATIRTEIGELGVALDLHTLRAGKLEAFCAALRAHAGREDALAYATAERSVTAEVARAMVDRLSAIVGPNRKSRARPTTTRSAP